MDNKSTNIVDQKVQALLNVLDRDGNGVITREDLHRSTLEMFAELDYLMAKVKVLSQEVIERNRFTTAVLAGCDTNRDGKLSRAEIEAAVKSRKLDIY